MFYRSCGYVALTGAIRFASIDYRPMTDLRHFHEPVPGGEVVRQQPPLSPGLCLGGDRLFIVSVSAIKMRPLPKESAKGCRVNHYRSKKIQNRLAHRPVALALTQVKRPEALPGLQDLSPLDDVAVKTDYRLATRFPAWRVPAVAARGPQTKTDRRVPSHACQYWGPVSGERQVTDP